MLTGAWITVTRDGDPKLVVETSATRVTGTRNFVDDQRMTSMRRTADTCWREGIAKARKAFFASRDWGLTLCFIVTNETRVEFSSKENGRELE